MKTLPFGLLALLCSCPAWAQKNTLSVLSGLSVSESAPAAFSSTPTAFEWKLSSPAGTKFRMRTHMKTKIAQNVPVPNQKTMRVESVMATTFDANYDVLNVDERGNRTVRVTYGKVLVSSDTRTDGHALPATASRLAKKSLDGYLNAFRGATFTMKITPQSEILAIQGLAELRSRLTKSLQKIPGAGVAGAEMVESLLGDARIKESFGRMNGQIPDYPILRGETWEYKTNLSASLPVAPQLEGRRTLSDLTASTATIRDFALIRLNSRERPLWKGNPMKVSLKFFGTQDGTSLISTRTGMPLRATMYQRMSGTTTVLSPDAAKQGQKSRVIVPLWSATEYTMTVSTR